MISWFQNLLFTNATRTTYAPADYARRMYTEFHVVRKLLDSQVHDRFQETRELRVTLQTVSMKMQARAAQSSTKAVLSLTLNPKP